MSAAEQPSPGAELVWAAGWTAFGGAMLYGGWTMDRLEAQHINPYTAPGLVPGLLGAGLVLMGVLLFVRALRAKAALAPAQADGDNDPARFAVSLALCLGYGLGLVGRAPFWLATFLFVFAAITVLQWRERRAAGSLGRGLALAAACAAGTALGVTLLFQELFLVRLP
jgi:hypothetical protein